MKTIPQKFYLGLALLLAAGSVLLATPRPVPENVVELLPAGPLLVLQAGKFSSLVRGWNRSPEKRTWLKSDSYKTFARSRLFLRLQDAQDEFAAAAGLPPDWKLAQSLAGSESAFALYDIGKLEFLYVTRLPSARAMESALWKLRSKFEPRQAAGLAYYIREEEKTKRVVSFAATDDYLLLATREDLLAGALTLLAGKGKGAVTGEPWYDYAVRAAKQPGSLRLVMNFEKVARTPHFRSYWIHSNQKELQSYLAVISDIHLTAGEIREERVFLRELSDGVLNPESSSKPNPAESALTGLLRLVPGNAGIYRAWAAPSGEQVMDLLTRKILRLGTSSAARSRTISARTTTDNFEIRIDRPPTVIRTGGFAPEKLSQVLNQAGIEAMLHLQASRNTDGNVFIQNESALVFRSKSGWKETEVCNALAFSVDSLWTTSRLGMQCVKKTARGHSYLALDGLRTLAVAARENYLLVATHPDLLAAVLENFSAPPSSVQGEYVAGFRHARERKHFNRMMRLLDDAVRYDRGRVPQFFSDNMGSFSDTLRRVQSVTITARRQGAVERQTITYHLSR